LWGGGAPLVQLGWRPPDSRYLCLQFLPLLHKKSRRQEAWKLSLNAEQPYAKTEGRVPAYPGCPGTKAIKWLLLLFLSYERTDTQADRQTHRQTDRHTKQLIYINRKEVICHDSNCSKNQIKI